MFIKQHGKFELKGELFIMIQKYQYKKYGDLLASGRRTSRKVKRGHYGKLENSRMNTRFGSKEERARRKLEERYGR